jgi:hypothetical protein
VQRRYPRALFFCSDAVLWLGSGGVRLPTYPGHRLGKKCICCHLFTLLCSMAQLVQRCCTLALAYTPMSALDALVWLVDFEGPTESGVLNAEEERLLASYPQPCDPVPLPPWRRPSSDSEPPLDITACFHAIAMRTIPTLFSAQACSCSADAFALLEGVLPVLVVAPLDRCSAEAAERVGEYLAALSRVLELQIRADEEHLLGDGSDDGARLLDETPVLSPVAVHTLALISRCGLFTAPHCGAVNSIICPSLSVI